ncbi:hypothetical protein D1006_10005 [Burkholderia stabilis]|uniref:Uncharacterized protein n=1 Tax=Burkholderia stabilis TaxID=95485 RepID=A0A4Q2AS32_9BURK|nr:hypothetical protein D1006_10005 [Burkholderia stabilis]
MCGERRAPVGPGGPQYGHIDTTRNQAAPEVELALIAIDFRGPRRVHGLAGVGADGVRTERMTRH